MLRKLKAALGERQRLVGIAIYGFATLQPRVIAAILTVIYARFLTVGDFGIYGILGSLVGIVSILADLGVPIAVVRNYIDRRSDPETAATFVSSVVRGSRVLSLCLLPLIGAVMFLGWDQVNVRGTLIWPALPMVIAVGYFDRSSEILSAVCRAMERPASFAIGRVAQGLAIIIAGVILVAVLHQGAVGALLAMLIGRVASSLTYQVILSRAHMLVTAPINWGDLKACLSFGLPLVPHRLLSWARESALRPLLAILISTSAAGLFSLACSLAAIPQIVAATVNLGLSPVYFRRKADGSAEFPDKMKRFALVLLGMLFPLWVTCVLFSGKLVEVIATSRFTAASGACAIMFCSAFARFQHSFLMRQLEFLRATWLVPVVTGTCTAMTVGATLLFARQHGINAAAWAVVLGDVSIAIALTLVVRRHERIDYPWGLSFGLQFLLILLAAWVSAGEPMLIAASSFVVKLVICAAVVVLSISLWVWPNRDLVRQLARG